MATFFSAWFALTFIALIFNYAVHSVNPRDDDP